MSHEANTIIIEQMREQKDEDAAKLEKATNEYCEAVKKWSEKAKLVMSDIEDCQRCIRDFSTSEEPMNFEAIDQQTKQFEEDGI